MSEQLENPNTEVIPETPEHSDIELKAMEMGWRPKEEFEGDEVDFIDAKEFVGRKPLYDKIASQSKQIKSVTEAVEALKVHYSKVKETEYQRAILDLKTLRKKAFTEGDADAYDVIDERIKNTEREVEKIREDAKNPIVKEAQEMHPEFVSWTNKNPWYTSTKYMREFADEFGARLAGSDTPANILKKVEDAVKKEFPHKFSNARKADAPDVGDNSSSSRSSKSAGISLNEQETRIMNTLVKSGAITKEKYIADLKLVKGIK